MKRTTMEVKFVDVTGPEYKLKVSHQDGSITTKTVDSLEDIKERARNGELDLTYRHTVRRFMSNRGRMPQDIVGVQQRAVERAEPAKSVAPPVQAAQPADGPHSDPFAGAPLPTFQAPPEEDELEVQGSFQGEMQVSLEPALCLGTTKKGSPCKNHAGDTGYCHLHAPSLSVYK